MLDKLADFQFRIYELNYINFGYNSDDANTICKVINIRALRIRLVKSCLS